MKVKDLIQHLQNLDQETEIRIFPHKNGRPICDLKPIQPTDIDYSIDQDSPKNSVYTIAVNTAFEYPMKEETLQIPETETADYISDEEISEIQEIIKSREPFTDLSSSEELKQKAIEYFYSNSRTKRN